MRAQFTTKRRVTMNYKKYLEDQLQTSIEAADHKSVYYAQRKQQIKGQKRFTTFRQNF